MSGLNFLTTKTQLKEISELRKLMGLPEIISGKRKCLRCDEIFLSNDVKNERMCKRCRNGNKEPDY